MSQQQLLYSISRYLSSLKGKDGVNDEDIDIITNIIDANFQVDNNEHNFEEFSLYPTSLQDIFAAGIEKLRLESSKTALQSVQADPKFESFLEVVSKKGYFEGTEVGSLEYLERQAKLVAKYKERTQKAEATAEENERKAEEKKVQGNAAISAKEYETAIQLYTDALSLSPDGPNSHIYYSNRAAAYTYLGDHQRAVDDCEASILLKDDYSKAYSRLGLSYFHLGKFEESAQAYERLVELEPDNKASREELRKVKKKLEGQKSKSAPVAAAGSPDLSSMLGDDASMPGLAGIMSNPMMKQAMDRAGGPAGIANLMKDPNMVAMAQQMMQNPEMMKQAMAMMGGGGGGGMPDMSSLASLMGGAGGAPSSSSSSSSRKGKQPFRGFEDA